MEQGDAEFRNLVQVIMEPPEARQDTDEESGPEDEADFSHMTGRQLGAPAVLVHEDEEREEDEPVINLTKGKWDYKAGQHLRTIGLPPFPEGNYSGYSKMPPHELFELFFSNELLVEITRQMSLYCVFKGIPDVRATVSELRVFIGIHLISGYHSFPRRRMYWTRRRMLAVSLFEML